MASSSEPNGGINIIEEMKKPYVVAYRSHFSEKEVPDETLVAAIKLFIKLKGDTDSNRRAEHFCDVVEHIMLSKEKMDVDILGTFPGFDPSPSEFKDMSSRKKEQQGKKNVQHENESLNQYSRQIQPVSLEEDIQDLHKDKKKIKDKDWDINDIPQLIKRIEALEDALVNEKKQRRALQHALQKERHEKEALQKENFSLVVDSFDSLEENCAIQLELLDKNRCLVCRVKEADMLFYPCNHVAACRACVGTLQNLPPDQDYRDKCPYCRIVYTKITKVWFA